VPRLERKEASFGAYILEDGVLSLSSTGYEGTISFELCLFFLPSIKEVPKLLNISLLLLAK
jgi:hypothetical protein